MYQLLLPPRPAIDDKWFGRLQTLLQQQRELFEMLEPSPSRLAEEYQRFVVSGYEAAPDLSADTIDSGVLRRYLTQLQQMMHDVADEPREVVRVAYIARISELMTGYEIAIAAAENDSYGFKTANLHLYGSPSGSLAKQCLAWIRSDCEQTVPATPRIADFQRQLISGLPAAVVDFQSLIPGDTVFKTVRDLHFATGGYIEQLFGSGGLPSQGYVEQAAGDAICRHVLKSLQSDFTVEDSLDGIWAVQRSRRAIVRPAGYRLDSQEFAGIVAHEIGSHLIESVNGQRQPLRLLATGLDRYEAGNEGRAFLREQIMYASPQQAMGQASWEYIVLLYVGVCRVALEGDGFPELYDFLLQLHRFWRERRFPMSANNETVAREESWQLAVRILKGVSPLMDGAGCYLKDTIYLTGNLRCWKLARTDPRQILLGDQGKYDVTNPAHRQILQLLAEG